MCKKPGNKDYASTAILSIRHSNSLTASGSITQPSNGSAYSVCLSLLCNERKTIPQTLLTTVSLMQASTMDRRDQAASINLFQTDSADESSCYFIAFLITISTRNTPPF